MAKRLFVGGLPYTTKEEELRALFSQVGEIVSIAIIIDKFTGQGKGFAFVEMKTEEEAVKAIALSGTDLGGRKIIVAEARPMEERAPRDNRSGGGYGGGYGRRDDGGRNDRRDFNGPKRW
jgi:RNA recognition motif-containing protein